MKKTLKILEWTELDIKRFYIDGSYHIDCSCGNKMEDSFNENYLSYPTVGSTEERYLECNVCGKEHVFEIKILSIKVEIEVPDNLL